METNDLILQEVRGLRLEVGSLKNELTSMKEEISKLIGKQINRSRSNSLERPVSEERYVTVLPENLQRRNTDPSVKYNPISPRLTSPRVSSPRFGEKTKRLSGLINSSSIQYEECENINPVSS